MDLELFIKQVIDQFDGRVSSFVADSKFKELSEYSSLTALSIIAMIDEEYGVSISGEDMRQSATVGELFELVKSRKE